MTWLVTCGYSFVLDERGKLLINGKPARDVDLIQMRHDIEAAGIASVGKRRMREAVRLLTVSSTPER